MVDFLNKIVTLIMIFLLGVVCPLMISYMEDDMQNKRVIMNDTENFIDRVTDKGTITQEDLDQFYISINSHSISMDANVKRLIRVSTVVDTGELKSTYFAADVHDHTEAGESVAEASKCNKVHILNSGDTVQVTVKEIGISPGRRLLYNLVRVDKGPFELTLAGTVR